MLYLLFKNPTGGISWNYFWVKNFFGSKLSLKTYLLDMTPSLILTWEKNSCWVFWKRYMTLSFKQAKYSFDQMSQMCFWGQFDFKNSSMGFLNKQNFFWFNLEPRKNPLIAFWETDNSQKKNFNTKTQEPLFFHFSTSKCLFRKENFTIKNQI